MSNYYPLIFYPPILEEFLASQSVPVKQPQTGFPPISSSPVPIPPTQPEFPKPMAYLKLVILSLLISLAVSGIASALVRTRTIAPFIFLFSVSIEVIWGWIYFKRNYHQQQVRYQKELADFKRQAFQYQQNLIELRKEQKLQDKTKLYQLKQRQQKLRTLLSNKVMISYQESTAQQGVSEQQFFKILQQYFPHISPGLMFAIPDSKYHYSTDFSLIDPTTGLSIDIEIDEPYEGRTKQPHHCLDQGKDRNRNQFFLAGNWVVIRFAEIQVVKYPHACAAAIASVLTQITGEDCYIKQFETIEPLPRVKPWTTAEARKMARKNFRQNYLNEMGIFVSSQKTRKKRSDRKK